MSVHGVALAAVAGSLALYLQGCGGDAAADLMSSCEELEVANGKVSASGRVVCNAGFAYSGPAIGCKNNLIRMCPTEKRDGGSVKDGSNYVGEIATDCVDLPGHVLKTEENSDVKKQHLAKNDDHGGILSVNSEKDALRSKGMTLQSQNEAKIKQTVSCSASVTVTAAAVPVAPTTASVIVTAAAVPVAPAKRLAAPTGECTFGSAEFQCIIPDVKNVCCKVAQATVRCDGPPDDAKTKACKKKAVSPLLPSLVAAGFDETKQGDSAYENQFCPVLAQSMQPDKFTSFCSLTPQRLFDSPGGDTLQGNHLGSYAAVVALMGFIALVVVLRRRTGTSHREIDVESELEMVLDGLE